jgi:hypothetical protein
MKKISLSLAIVLAILLGSMPALAAIGKSNLVYWIGEYQEEAWTGINVSTIDGKKNTSKRLFKEPASSIAIMGDWVYFVKQDPNAEIRIGNITKMKKDGTQLREITKGNRVGQFKIEGQSIYYDAYDDDNNLTLNVMKLDGTGTKLLIAKLPTWSYIVGKGTIFYVDTSGDRLLHQMKLDGTDQSVISSGEVQSSEGYKLFGDTLFYSEFGTDVTKWYLVDVTGKNKVSLTSKVEIRPVSYLNQWFYFEEVMTSKNGTQTQTLVKIKRDGTQKKTVANLGAKDRFIGLLDNSFVYKTSADKVYQIGLDGKIKKPAK